MALIRARIWSTSMGPAVCKPVAIRARSPARPLLYSMVMHLVATSDPSSQRWRWLIVDPDGQELAASPAEYLSMADALDAGRGRYQEVMRKHRPEATRARGVRVAVRHRR